MGCVESSPKPQTANGPKYRVCTDVCWLAIYIIFWLFLIVIAIFSFVYGNPLRIINGYDSFGNTCGVKTNERYANFPLSGMDTLDKPDLLYFDVTELKRSLKICVKECPKKTLKNRDELVQYYNERHTQLCRYDFNMSTIANPAVGKFDSFFNFRGPCPSFPIYESTPVLHRCIPKGKSAPVKEMYDMLNSWDVTEQFISDIYTTWHIVALVCGIALLTSIALVVMMHWLASIVSWLICLIVVTVSTVLTALLWYCYYTGRTDLKMGIELSLLEEFVRNEQAVFYLAIIATITTLVLLVIFCFLQSKVDGLTALFEEAGICMMNLQGLFIAPLLGFLVLVVFLAFWVFVVVCMVTATEPGQSPVAPFDNSAAHRQIATTNATFKNNTDADYKTIFGVEYIEVKAIRSMFWIYIVGLIWTVEFIFACQQFAIAAAVAFWYFEKPTSTPTFYAIGKLLKYHLGTVAKGSFIITLFKIPRLILTYLYAKLKKGEDKGSQCAACCLKCCVCVFYLLESFIRFLNHNAYTVVAIESINFCPAAGIAWNAMASNTLQVATINTIGDLVLFLGKVIVAAVGGIVAILLLKDRPDVNFYMAPVIVAIIFSFFIAHIVLALFEMVVDTLFLCVCEDKKIHGRGGRWAQSNLAKLVGEEPLQPGEEPPIQVVELMPINKQPFSVNKLPPSTTEQAELEPIDE